MLLADRWPPIAVSIAFAVGGLLLQFSQPMGHDLAWLVHATGRLLDGADVYGRDLVEWNPPANLHLLVPPVFLARWLDVSVLPAVRVWVTFVIGCSLLVANALARVSFADAPQRRWMITVLAFALYVFVGGGYGQREHLIVALMLPEILLVGGVLAGSTAARAPASLAGAMAGLAICLKPHYILVVVLLELGVLIRARSPGAWLRADLYSLSAIVSLELVVTILATPDYVLHVVPLALDSYWVYQAPLASIVELADLAWLVGGLAALMLVGRSGAFHVALVLLAAGVCFYSIALAQRTGWDYHLIPFHVVLIALYAMAVLRLLTALAATADADPAIHTAWRAAIASALGGLTLAGVLYGPTPYGEIWSGGAVWRRGGTEGFVSLLEKAMIEHAEGGTVYVISPSLVSIFPAVQYAGVRWGSRFAGFYLPAAVVRQRRGDPEVPSRLTAERADEIEAYLRDAVVEDLRRDPPDLILVDTVRRRKVFAGVPFDFADYLSEDPRLAEIFAGYETIGRVGRFAAAVRR